MDKNELAEIRNLPAAELAERLPAMSADDLVALRELEAAEAEPRAEVLAAIDEAAKTAKPAESETPTSGKQNKRDAKAADKAKADETPDWQKPDYTGPLDIEQAQWRHRNIKPVQAVKTK